MKLTEFKTAMDRRNFLGLSAGLATQFVRPQRGTSFASAASTNQRKSVAAVVTVYRKNSHADVIVSKILKGWKHDGGPGPALDLAAIYVDQFPEGDMSRALSDQFGFRIAKSIDEAMTLGTDQIAVDGVLSIGEHGDYPWNDLGQHLYPRRRFFREITDTFERCGKVVPVFNDKHPGPVWQDAWWMYQRAKALNVPWMAGSSLPVSFRDPDLTLPFGGQVAECLAVGYSGLDIYGFHTLDFLQCILERRQAAEQGVKSVQSYPTEAVSKLIADGTISDALLHAGLKSSGTDKETVIGHPDPKGAVFVIEYLDGLTVPVLMLPGQARAISVAFRQPNGPVQATRTEERSEPRYPHFAYLLKGIEQMFHTGKPAYPVERTVLVAGILDRLLNSRRAGNVKRMTPELAIAYRPVDYGYAPHLDLQRRW